MQFDHQGKLYHMIRASDLKRDGMGLELACGNDTIADVFYSDTTGEFTISVFKPSLPLEIVERLIAEARVDLPPVTKS